MKTTPTRSQKLATRLAFSLTATIMIAPAQQAGPERNRRDDARAQRDQEVAPVPRRMTKRQRRSVEERPHLTERNDQIEVPSEYRTIDGSNNNLTHLNWGRAEEVVIRLTEAAYADGLSDPVVDRSSARTVSNAVAAQEESILNRRGASDFLWQWGQFIDHDIIETPTIDPAEPFDIEVPADDSHFIGIDTILLNRSLYEEHDGVRQQINAITAYIDASMVYGSDEERAYALRRLDSTGKLKTSESEHGDLLPFNEGGFPNSPSESPTFFLAGDVRANEQVGLTAMHTLFVREHNHWAERYRDLNPEAMDEEIYQFARMIVAAEIQAITYREWLPILLGKQAIPRYRGYQESVRADISNEFGAAAFRIGHSMLSPILLRVDQAGHEIDAGHLSLTAAFFNPALTVDVGLEPVLRGLAQQQCQELDEKIIDEVRNFLFGRPGAGGFDLAALNIQRGRDHGIPAYNTARKLLGLRPIRSFRQITRDRETIKGLRSVYPDVNQADLWITALAERKVRGSMVGETFQKILVDQFTRLRDGDRFFYKHALPAKLVAMVERQTLAHIIRRNTEIGNEVPDNVFLITPSETQGPRSPNRRNRKSPRRR